MGSDRAQQLYQELNAAWSSGATTDDSSKVNGLLAQLKIELSQLGLLFPSADANLDVGALTTAREVLEVGAFQSIRSQDVPAFERYLNLLGPYYNDLSSKLPKSTNEAPLFALSLLRLLSQNRIAEFHTLLETLPKDTADSTEVAWVLKVERSLMEGSYSRVWQLCRGSQSSSSSHATASSLPRPEFAFFVSTLVGTVRNEIASCDERAYETLPLRDAKTLLFFDDEKDVREFAKGRNWHIDASSIVHFPSSPRHPSKIAGDSTATSATTGVPNSMTSGDSSASRELNKERVVQAALSYAKELETIV